MTLKERILNVLLKYEIAREESRVKMIESITEEFAYGFAEWMSKHNFLPNKGWYTTSYEIEMDIFKSTKELLEIYKKQNNL